MNNGKVIATSGAAAVIICLGLALSACAPRPRCSVISFDKTIGGEIEVCERMECRDLSNGRLVSCDGVKRLMPNGDTRRSWGNR